MDLRPTGYEELMQTIERQQVVVKPVDLALFYSGFDRLLLDMDRKPDRERLFSQCATLDGNDPRLRQWIVDSGVVALCSDTIAVEWLGNMLADTGAARLPIHDLCLFKQGIFLGELRYLEELADWLAAHRRSSFLLPAYSSATAPSRQRGFTFDHDRDPVIPLQSHDLARFDTE
jgi:hypothetical protein